MKIRNIFFTVVLSLCLATVLQCSTSDNTDEGNCTDHSDCDADYNEVCSSDYICEIIVCSTDNDCPEYSTCESDYCTAD